MNKWMAWTGMVAGGVLTLAGSAGAQGPIPTPIGKSSIVVELATVATGLNQPNYLTHARDGSGRTFVLERNGQIRVINAGGLVATPFLTIAGVLTGSERGLLGLAFHPGYNDPGSPGFRTFYTYTSEAASVPPDFVVPAGGGADHHSVIAEWKTSALDPNIADSTSRREILRIGQPQGNHNGGTVAFSPVDGFLYISLGDGGASNDNGVGHTPGVGNGQDASNVLGSILRIDPLDPAVNPSVNPVSANGKYRVPTANPFATPADSIPDETFAIGFRNPYRMSFDPVTGQLYAGDVGQNNIEEVDIVTSGGNYGWRHKEGTFLFNPATGGVSTGPDPVPGLTDPVLQYDHDEGISIIGGFVYRGTQIPSLVGSYVFGDFNSPATSNGRLFVGNPNTGVIQELVIGTTDRLLGGRIIGFGEDESRELYVMTTNFAPNDGTVFRITALQSAAPEPATLALIGSGLLLLGVVRRRR